MSERRKPALTLVAKKRGKGKRWKAELFLAEEWPGTPRRQRDQYRVRVDGKWVGGLGGWIQTHTITDVMAQLRQHLCKKRRGESEQ